MSRRQGGHGQRRTHLFNAERNQKPKNNYPPHTTTSISSKNDDLLAINKCVTYCGPQAIGKPGIQKQIYGETVCVETQKGE
jgi:hypothetical protein